MGDALFTIPTFRELLHEALDRKGPMRLGSSSKKGDNSLYIIGRRGGETAKIGRTTSLNSRLAGIQTGNPERLELVAWWTAGNDYCGGYGGNIWWLEGAVHAALVDAGIERTPGGRDWFFVEPQEIADAIAEVLATSPCSLWRSR